MHAVSVHWRFINLNQVYKSYDQYFYVHRLFLYSKREILTQVFFFSDFSYEKSSLKKKSWKNVKKIESTFEFIEKWS